MDEFDRDRFVGSVDITTSVPDLIGTPMEKPIVPETMRFSATRLKMYKDCPLQFKFSYVMKIPEPPGVAPAAAKGTSIHAVIENLDLTKPVKEQVARLLESNWTPDQFESQTQSEQNKTSAYDLIDTYLAWQEKNQNMNIGSEKEFSFTFAGREMHGYIDRIEQTPDGGYVVIDFKSGKKPSDITKKSIPENIQLNLYAMAIREMFGKLPERATLFYLKDNKLVDYQPTEESIAAFGKSLEEILDTMYAGEFPAQPDFRRCGWCPYGDLCESRESAEE
jgi:DNA helicase-2/ATP-dependent DNA helicase PcrA